MIVLELTDDSPKKLIYAMITPKVIPTAFWSHAQWHFFLEQESYSRQSTWALGDRQCCNTYCDN